MSRKKNIVDEVVMCDGVSIDKQRAMDNVKLIWESANDKMEMRDVLIFATLIVSVFSLIASIVH